MAEVLGQGDAEDAGGAQGDVHAAGEVAVQLQGIEHGRRRDHAAVIGCVVGEDGLDHQVEAVGDDHLLGKAPKDAHAAPVEVVLVDGSAGPELLGRLTVTADGAFHDLGEEAQEKRDPAQVGVGRDGAAIDVEEVRRRHERVERDADGHADVRHRHGHVQAEERKKRPRHLAEED